MDIFVSEKLWSLLLISLTFSIFLMAFIQKMKALGLIKNKYQIFIIDLILSFILGIPFGILLYNLNIMDASIMSVFGFIGAPSIYDTLKSQNILAYKPKSMSDINSQEEKNISISKDNEIKRD